MVRLELAGAIRWLCAPLQRLVEDAENILGQGNLLISGRQVSYLGAI
jgi:hypothetical protein